MINGELIQAHHLKRRAVIYIRQSTGHQVLTNQESRRMQHAMKEHAVQLGWDEQQVETVETDTAITAASTAGREAYKSLLSDIALGQVGIVLSYESARLSRNCSDWYPLLDVCAFKSCLIADRDGIYDPSEPNGRLLLGMKGILSEVELHTLRGRLIAGVQNKARRGELALALPVGLIRLEDGRVVKDPDRQVQDMIDMTFHFLLQLKSAAKVVRYFNQQGLKIPRRHRNQETVWRPASIAAVVCIARNPAYAGAFVYGKTKTIRKLDGSRPQQKRREMEDWTVMIKDRYPSYISWETFEQIQSMLSNNYAEYDRNRTRGVPRKGAALLQGLVYCGKCGHKMVVQYKGGTRYLCNYHRQQMQKSVCQFLSADPIDQKVVEAFFQALSPAELDLYDKAVQTRRNQRSQVDKAQQRELQRLRYEVEFARRQYDKVDPDNRLVASELERRWEKALRLLQQAEQAFEKQRQQHDKVVPIGISKDLREAFSSLGQSLPTFWEKDTLSRTQRKELLRCLIDKVVVYRTQKRDVIHTRIVWRGGATTDFDLLINVGSLHDLSDFDKMEKRILMLETEGRADEEIADILSAEGFRSPQKTRVLSSTVQNIRLRHGRIHRFSGPRPRRIQGFLTVPQIAQAIDVKPHWLYARTIMDPEKFPNCSCDSCILLSNQL